MWSQAYEKVIGWGTSSCYQRYSEEIKGSLAYLIDNNPVKQGSEVDEIKIYGAEALKEEKGKNILIVIFSDYFEEIRAQVGEYGVFDIVEGRVLYYLCREDCYSLEEVKVNCRGREINLSFAAIEAFFPKVGVSRFIKEQNELMKRNGYEVLQIVPLQFYKKDQNQCQLAILSDNKLCGVHPLDTLIDICQNNSRVRNIIIHSLGYTLEEALFLMNHIKVENKIIYYLHDFACICERITLLKEQGNCEQFPSIDCDKECSGYRSRKYLFDYHAELFNRENTVLVAPSKTVANVIRQMYGSKPDVRIIGHLTYQKMKQTVKTNEKLRVAFVGSTFTHKGWEWFKKVVERYKDRYEFYCLGRCVDGNKISGVCFIDVSFEPKENEINMKEALLKYRIDIAYLGSIWRETYSYTYFETYEAGTFIVATVYSGNIYEEIKNNKNGFAISKIEDFYELLEAEEKLRKMLSENTERIHQVKMNDQFLNLL